ncbi:MAG: hypothetical protein JNJ55_13260 [Betaproteobacteria bacterium]|nr:hypothetical protein [Betaproteobacteria bacterium]
MRWSRVLLTWLAIVLAESIHGVLRQAFLVPRIGDLPARQWGVLIGSLIILAIALTTARWIGANSFSKRLRIGAVWVLLIVVFEITLGRAMGMSWGRILSDYDVARGGFMAFGLLFLLFSPVLAGAIRARWATPKEHQ